MSSASERFAMRAQQLGADVDVRTYPEGTRTAVDAANAIRCQVDQIVKSLVFMADDQPVLVLVAGSDRADELRVADCLGVEVVRKASAGEVRDATGYAIGGTPPFGHEGELTVICDRALLDHDLVWAAAGTPTTVFSLTPQQLVDWSHAQVETVRSSAS